MLRYSFPTTISMHAADKATWALPCIDRNQLSERGITGSGGASI